MDGEVRGFSAGGIIDGLFLLVDDETGTFWHHVSGEAVYGPRVDLALETFAIEVTTAAAAQLAEPDLAVSLSTGIGVLGGIFAWSIGDPYREGGALPSLFTPLMISRGDERLPRMEGGLGVVVGEVCEDDGSAHMNARVNARALHRRTKLFRTRRYFFSCCCVHFFSAVLFRVGFLFLARATDALHARRFDHFWAKQHSGRCERVRACAWM